MLVTLATIELPDGMTIAFALTAAAVVLAFRKRLPAGLCAGVTVAAASGSTLIFFAANEYGSFWLEELGHCLAGLTVFWYAFSRFAARKTRSTESNASAALMSYAALSFGCAAIVFLLATAPRYILSESSAAVDFLLLCIPAMSAVVFRTGRWAWYPALSLLLCLMIPMTPRRLIAAAAEHGSWGLMLAGFLCFASVIALVLDAWRRRRRRWIEAPEYVADDAPPPKVLLACVIFISICVGVGGLICLENALTPVAIFLAALACFIVGHVLECLISGEIGLLLSAEAIVSAAMAWITPGWTGALLGCIVATGFLVWLARFWRQQLDDGLAWTTAGRLIPAARRLAYTTAWLTLAAACGAWAWDFIGPNASSWKLGVTAHLALACMSLLTRDGAEHGLAAACAMAFVTGLVFCEFIAVVFDINVLPTLCISGAALLMTLRMLRIATKRQPIERSVSQKRRPPRVNPSSKVNAEHTAMITAVVGGAIPITVLIVISKQGMTAQGLLALLTAATGMYIVRNLILQLIKDDDSVPPTAS